MVYWCIFNRVASCKDTLYKLWNKNSSFRSSFRLQSSTPGQYFDMRCSKANYAKWLKKTTLKSFSSFRTQDTYDKLYYSVCTTPPSNICRRSSIQYLHQSQGTLHDLAVHSTWTSTAASKFILVQQMLEGFTASVARLDEGL